MQFINDNGIYKVARITGPQHNLLAIRLSEQSENIEIVSLPIKGNETINVDKQDVLKQVNAGLNSINEKLGKEYFISEIQYVPSDSNTPKVYEFLIKELIKRIDNKGEFISV